MTKQFEQLKMLYKLILATTVKVKKFIEKENYDEALSRETHKAQLISKINIVKNSFDLTDFEQSTLRKIVEDIQKQEMENISTVKDLKDDTALKLKALKAKSKITNKYSGDTEPQEGSILDFNE